jgi:hypothetical protein
MKIDPGLVVVIGAVLVFYLRLIILQRERIKRARQDALTVSKKHKRSQALPQPPSPGFSILSQSRSDRLIAGVGLLAILLGLLLNARFLGLTGLEAYWWAPLAIGIIAFSWGFKL